MRQTERRKKIAEKRIRIALEREGYVVGEGVNAWATYDLVAISAADKVLVRVIVASPGRITRAHALQLTKAARAVSARAEIWAVAHRGVLYWIDAAELWARRPVWLTRSLIGMREKRACPVPYEEDEDDDIRYRNAIEPASRRC